MTEPRKVVHVLREGRALCGRPGIPSEWSDIERWCFEDQTDRAAEVGALCVDCLAVTLGKPPPSSFGKDHVVALSDRSGQVMTHWCKHCGGTFKFHLPCSIRLFGAIARVFVKEHQACKRAEKSPEVADCGEPPR